MSNTLKSYLGVRRETSVINRMMEMNERKLDLSLNQDDPDLFSEDINSPTCTSISYDCLKNLDKKVHEMHLLLTIKNDTQIKGSQHLKGANDAIKFINEKFEGFKVDRREKEREIVELKSTMNLLM